LIVTREARLGLNGPQVIEQEAGIEEYDSRDRPFIWSLTGGEQRHACGLADAYVADDLAKVREALVAQLAAGEPALPRSRRHADFLALLATLGT
ncbi:biotin-independent malonate decarboxylase subunit beta, partial [Klebsiella pneumoniae]